MKIEFEFPDELKIWLDILAKRDDLPLEQFLRKELAESIRLCIESVTVATSDQEPKTALEAVEHAESITPEIRRLLERLTQSDISLWEVAELERDRESRGFTLRNPETMR